MQYFSNMQYCIFIFRTKCIHIVCSPRNVIQTFIELELLLLLEPSSLLSLCSTDCLLIIRSLFDWRLPYMKGIIGSHNTLILIQFFVWIRDSSIVILYIDSIDAEYYALYWIIVSYKMLHVIMKCDHVHNINIHKWTLKIT